MELLIIRKSILDLLPVPKWIRLIPFLSRIPEKAGRLMVFIREIPK